MLSPYPSPSHCFGTRRKRAISQHLVSIFQSETDCLKPLPDCLPSLALEYSSSSSYASSSSTTSAWGTDKGSENDTSKHKKQAEKNADCTIKSTQQKKSDLKPRSLLSLLILFFPFLLVFALTFFPPSSSAPAVLWCEIYKHTN
ncbi:hypothetical protein EV1_046300 [Malus domestica]